MLFMLQFVITKILMNSKKILNNGIYFLKKIQILSFQEKTQKILKNAKNQNKTAIFYGLQNCSPIEDNIEYVEILKKQGVLFMQLTYNNQSLLATGCYEKEIVELLEWEKKLSRNE